MRLVASDGTTLIAEPAFRIICPSVTTVSPGLNPALITAVVPLVHLIGLGRIIPTVLITAFPNARDKAWARRAGVTCYLPKPFTEAQLLDCIHEALEQRNIVGR